MSSALLARIARSSLHDKIMKAEDTIPFFKNGMNLGWSGFTPVGYPKGIPSPECSIGIGSIDTDSRVALFLSITTAVPLALADHVEKNNLQGKLKFNLFIGASGSCLFFSPFPKRYREDSTGCSWRRN